MFCCVLLFLFLICFNTGFVTFVTTVKERIFYNFRKSPYALLTF